MAMVAIIPPELIVPRDRQRAPVPGVRGFPHALSSRRPAIAAGHLRRRFAFVDEHQAPGIDRGYLLAPRLTAATAFFAVLFTGVDRPFSDAGPSSATLAIAAPD